MRPDGFAEAAIVDLPVKDVSELYIREGKNFEQVFGDCLNRSVVAVEAEQQITISEREEAGRELWETCESLANEPQILERVSETFGEMI